MELLPNSACSILLQEAESAKKLLEVMKKTVKMMESSLEDLLSSHSEWPDLTVGGCSEKVGLIQVTEFHEVWNSRIKSFNAHWELYVKNRTPVGTSTNVTNPQSNLDEHTIQSLKSSSDDIVIAPKKLKLTKPIYRPSKSGDTPAGAMTARVISTKPKQIVVSSSEYLKSIRSDYANITVKGKVTRKIFRRIISNKGTSKHFWLLEFLLDNGDGVLVHCKAWDTIAQKFESKIKEEMMISIDEADAHWTSKDYNKGNVNYEVEMKDTTIVNQLS